MAEVSITVNQTKRTKKKSPYECKKYPSDLVFFPQLHFRASLRRHGQAVIETAVTSGPETVS